MRIGVYKTEEIPKCLIAFNSFLEELVEMERVRVSSWSCGKFIAAWRRRWELGPNREFLFRRAASGSEGARVVCLPGF